MTLYEILVLGDVSPVQAEKLSATLVGMFAGFGLRDEDVAIRTSADAAMRSNRAATVAAYFGGGPDVDAALLRELIRESVPVVPTIGAGQVFENALPSALHAINGLRRRDDDPDMIELATILLECVGLLHRQRRVFVSYRREESQVAAIQLHDSLSARGFGVFLDTHSIRPGENFQDELWHQMCDCDVLVMLDTETYFSSRWTREEIAKARAKDLQVLRIVWPGLTPSRLTDMSETVALVASDVDAAAGPLALKRLNEIALRVETLRSRSIASRHRTMAGRLEADVVRVGGNVEGIGAHRAISIQLLNGRRLWAYPVVGIPTAETLHDVAEKTRRAGQDGTPVLVYDHIGIRDRWVAHLAWLGEQIPSVRWLKITEAAWALAGMED